MLGIYKIANWLVFLVNKNGEVIAVFIPEFLVGIIVGSISTLIALIVAAVIYASDTRRKKK